MLNEKSVKGIVMFEGIFRPVKDALKCMSISSRLTMRIMRKENMKNIEVKYIGEGKHFFPEDQAKNIGEAIVEFIKRM